VLSCQSTPSDENCREIHGLSGGKRAISSVQTVDLHRVAISTWPLLWKPASTSAAGGNTSAFGEMIRERLGLPARPAMTCHAGLLAVVCETLAGRGLLAVAVRPGRFPVNIGVILIRPICFKTH